MISTKQYPIGPGVKTDNPETSREAANAIDGQVAALREQVLLFLAFGAATADECASGIGQTILSVRPRLSELRAMGRIEPTGLRRRNASGRSATVWQMVTKQTQQEFNL